MSLLLSGLGRHGSDDVGVSRVGDGQCADAEELSACGAQVDVRAVVVVNARLRQHRVVLDLRLSEIFIFKHFLKSES